ncbi:MAG: putative cysteine protease YraA [Firmicutes bacterium ADurb.Bin419]|nr:MAG: putative cysteine protease YraA [Firmicutes bacterium ADurb.Bin419]
MRKFKKVLGSMLIFAMIFSLSAQIWAKPMKKIQKHKSKPDVLMVIAPKNVEDLELFVPKSILEAKGAKVTVASTTMDISTGTHGALIKPDMKISDVKLKKFDAVIVVGGTGAIEFLWEDVALRQLLIEANDKGKIVGAICGAPPALSKAGILEGKKATMYPWDDGIKELEKYGAIYVDEEVVVSDNIITGRNVDASAAYGTKLCELLELAH